MPVLSRFKNAYKIFDGWNCIDRVCNIRVGMQNFIFVTRANMEWKYEK